MSRQPEAKAILARFLLAGQSPVSHACRWPSAHRHPGYVGYILSYSAMAVMLGSLWALIPAGLAALLIVLRTALEDRTLREELAGYKEYAQRVRYRLLPGVW